MEIVASLIRDINFIMGGSEMSSTPLLVAGGIVLGTGLFVTMCFLALKPLQPLFKASRPQEAEAGKIKGLREAEVKRLRDETGPLRERPAHEQPKPVPALPETTEDAPSANDDTAEIEEQQPLAPQPEADANPPSSVSKEAGDPQPASGETELEGPSGSADVDPAKNEALDKDAEKSEARGAKFADPSGDPATLTPPPVSPDVVPEKAQRERLEKLAERRQARGPRLADLIKLERTGKIDAFTGLSTPAANATPFKSDDKPKALSDFLTKSARGEGSDQTAVPAKQDKSSDQSAADPAEADASASAKPNGETKARLRSPVARLQRIEKANLSTVASKMQRPSLRAKTVVLPSKKDEVAPSTPGAQTPEAMPEPSEETSQQALSVTAAAAIPASGLENPASPANQTTAQPAKVASEEAAQDLTPALAKSALPAATPSVLSTATGTKSLRPTRLVPVVSSKRSAEDQPAQKAVDAQAASSTKAPTAVVLAEADRSGEAAQIAKALFTPAAVPTWPLAARSVSPKKLKARQDALEEAKAKAALERAAEGQNASGPSPQAPDRAPLTHAPGISVIKLRKPKPAAASVALAGRDPALGSAAQTMAPATASLPKEIKLASAEDTALYDEAIEEIARLETEAEGKARAESEAAYAEAAHGQVAPAESQTEESASPGATANPMGAPLGAKQVTRPAQKARRSLFGAPMKTADGSPSGATMSPASEPAPASASPSASPSAQETEDDKNRATARAVLFGTRRPKPSFKAPGAPGSTAAGDADPASAATFASGAGSQPRLGSNAFASGSANRQLPENEWMAPYMPRKLALGRSQSRKLRFVKAAPKRLPPAEPILAVTPFDDGQSDQLQKPRKAEATKKRPETPASLTEESALTEALTKDMATRLAKLPGMAVVAPSHCLEQPKKLSGLALSGGADSNLDRFVRYDIEGGVTPLGDRVRVTAVLTDRKTGARIWGRRHQCLRKELPHVQAEFAVGMAEALVRHRRSLGDPAKAILSAVESGR